jgi:hypothetical protein
MTARRGAAAPDRDGTAASCEETGFGSIVGALPGATPPATFPARPDVRAFAPAPGRGLSNRALNVLKILAAELTGESPPRERWTPSSVLLRQITFKRLTTARNCGPQTVGEIIRWAQSQGVTIQPPHHAGKSLAETWKVLCARSATGELTHAEIAEALEKSVRRKNMSIPIAVQKLLLQLLNTAGGKAPT